MEPGAPEDLVAPAGEQVVGDVSRRPISCANRGFGPGFFYRCVISPKITGFLDRVYFRFI